MAGVAPSLKTDPKMEKDYISIHAARGGGALTESIDHLHFFSSHSIFGLRFDILFEVDPLQAYLLFGSRHPFVLNDEF